MLNSMLRIGDNKIMEESISDKLISTQNIHYRLTFSLVYDSTIKNFYSF